MTGRTLSTLNWSVLHSNRGTATRLILGRRVAGRRPPMVVVVVVRGGSMVEMIVSSTLAGLMSAGVKGPDMKGLVVDVHSTG
jgi:hypothetical protein